LSQVKLDKSTILLNKSLSVNLLCTIMHISNDLASLHDPEEQEALERLGAAVRALRRRIGISRKDLAQRAGLSLRFLAQLEAGEGNIAYLRLCRVAQALEVDPPELVAWAQRLGERPVALMGLRGAGKSAVGKALADRLQIPFLELTALVEDKAGMTREQIFDLLGLSAYRRLEHDALERCLSTHQRSVITTPGGLVTEPKSFALLQRRAFTVWLKALPEEHWQRVVDQGDLRPMRDRPEAFAELNRLWTQRAPLYAGADLTIETSGRSVDEVAESVLAALPRFAPSDRGESRARSNHQEN
jgi:XRE family aerobic/anaerobic benzoate catabolism transcriptional regulator